MKMKQKFFLLFIGVFFLVYPYAVDADDIWNSKKAKNQSAGEVKKKSNTSKIPAQIKKFCASEIKKKLAISNSIEFQNMDKEPVIPKKDNTYEIAFLAHAYMPDGVPYIHRLLCVSKHYPHQDVIKLETIKDIVAPFRSERYAKVPPEFSKEWNFISEWVLKVVPSAMTFSHKNYKTRLDNSMQYFTEKGWKSFNEDLKNSQTMSNLENKPSNFKRILSARNIKFRGIKKISVGNKVYYEWKLDVQLLSYEESITKKGQRWKKNIFLIIPILATDQGIKIDNWVRTDFKNWSR